MADSPKEVPLVRQAGANGTVIETNKLCKVQVTNLNQILKYLCF